MDELKTTTVVTFNDKTYTLENLSDGELATLKVNIGAAIEHVNTQINVSRSRYALTGENRGREWYMAANVFRRHCVASIAAIKNEFRRREQLKKPAGYDFHRAFVACAKHRLPADMFQALSREAEQRAEAELAAPSVAGREQS